MIGFHMGDHMMGSIHAGLSQVVELSGLARFYCDACIGIGGAIVGVVAEKFRALLISGMFFLAFGRPGGGHPIIAFRSPAVMLFYFLLLVGRYFLRLIFSFDLQFISKCFGIIHNLFLCDTVHRSVGLDECAVYSLSATRHHTFLDAQL